MKRQFFFAMFVYLVVGCSFANAEETSVLFEAESFADRGGWKLDTQFIDEMGSPYLLAHGIGQPVANATTTVTFPKTGKYHVWVRTKDWVARWKAKGSPGRFNLIVNGAKLETEFGSKGAAWDWQSGGTINVNSETVKIELKDLTGFDGRCDAIYFSMQDAEGIRDWNLRAVYGAFNAMKNRDGADKHKTAILTWVAYVGGPRESRRLIGDVQLTKEDIVSKRAFKDGSVPTTWSIDLHYPKEQYAEKFPDNPFISKAVHDRNVDRNYGYPVPYRCFYSKNIENLFVAGRCVSVTHEALGTVRVMKTCGMMGEVVGKAASICRQHDCSPRVVYEQYWDAMDKLLQLPSGARRANVNAEIVMPDVIPDVPGGGAKLKLPGVAQDDSLAIVTGDWKFSSGVKGFEGTGYQYVGGGSKATMTFKLSVKEAGTYDVRVGWRPHENRASNAKVIVRTGKGDNQLTLNMKKAPEIEEKFQSLGKYELEPGTRCFVVFDAAEADGIVCADFVQLLPAK